MYVRMYVRMYVLHGRICKISFKVKFVSILEKQGHSSLETLFRPSKGKRGQFRLFSFSDSNTYLDTKIFIIFLRFGGLEIT